MKQLTPEQIQSMTAAEKDAWWYLNVYRPNDPQLTFRSIVTGAVLGGLLSITNIFVGYKSGWTLGTGITAVVLAFAVFKILHSLGWAKDMGILENNCSQSIATSAGYMTAPLFSSLGALMMIQGRVIPQHQVILWLCTVSVLGVLMAFPLKRRYINDEQRAFPEGYAAGVVLDQLHNGSSSIGKLKARILWITMGITSLIEVLKAEKLFAKIGERWGAWCQKFACIPEMLDQALWRIVGWQPHIRGFPIEKLTIGVETDIPLIAAGGFMDIRVGTSMMVGAVINYFIAAPWLMEHGVINPEGGFKEIVKWSVWFGASFMTSASLTSFFAKPGTFSGMFKGLLRSKKRDSNHDILKDVELPIWMSYVGVPLFGILVAYQTHCYFGTPVWAGLLAIPIILLLNIIAVHATALTSVTPGKALGNLTQLFYSVITPGQVTMSLMAAGIASETTLNAANLITDIKPGYMHGARPRQQAIGHVIGIVAGAVVVVPVWYLLFDENVSLLGTKQFPMPSATTWKAIAEVLSHGVGSLHVSAQLCILAGLISGIVLEVLYIKKPSKFPISTMGFGLAFTMPFTNSLSMFLGCFAFWFVKKLNNKHWFVENQDTIAGAGIAGGSITGIFLKLIS